MTTCTNTSYFSQFIEMAFLSKYRPVYYLPHIRLRLIPFGDVSSWKRYKGIFSIFLSLTRTVTVMLFWVDFVLITLKRLFGQPDNRTSQSFINCFIRPHWDFGDVIFPSSLQKERILRWANKSVRGHKLKPHEQCFKPLNRYSSRHRHFKRWTSNEFMNRLGSVPI